MLIYKLSQEERRRQNKCDACVTEKGHYAALLAEHKRISASGIVWVYLCDRHAEEDRQKVAQKARETK